MRTMTPKSDLVLWARTVDGCPPASWQSVLERLQDEFEEGYSIKKLPTCWLAFDLDPDTTTEPTIIKDTVEGLVRTLLSPGPRYGTY